MAALTVAQRVEGSLLGAAVGDALGAPTECWDYRDIRTFLGDCRNFTDLEQAFAALAERDTAAALARVQCPPLQPIGSITDDTVLADLLLDAILETGGQLTAHGFARMWDRFDEPIDMPGRPPLVRLDAVHWIERIPFLRNRLHEIEKRELGHGEANATNAIMYIGPVGLLCAADPLMAELMAVDVTAVNQHGAPRDVAGGYAAALAACFDPDIELDTLVALAMNHTRHRRHCREMQAMLDLARMCGSGDEYIERYYDTIIGRWIPYRDRQHEESPKKSVTTWNSAEILGNALASLLLTRDDEPSDALVMCARIGRDADTIARAAGGLIGALHGPEAIPAAWREHVHRRNNWFGLDRHLNKAAPLTQLIASRARRNAASARKLLG